MQLVPFVQTFEEYSVTAGVKNNIIDSVGNSDVSRWIPHDLYRDERSLEVDTLWCAFACWFSLKAVNDKKSFSENLVFFVLILIKSIRIDFKTL